MPRRHRAGRLAAALLLVPAAVGCGAADAGGSGGGDTLTVLAAASLTDAFTRLAGTFERRHGVDVRLSFGSSTDLAEQAADGAPGDVLATADPTAMRIAEQAGVAQKAVTFATNRLTLVTPPGDPGGVDGLGDLAGSTWVRCADEVPCGRVALAVLEAHGVTAEPASLEEDVRSALDKVVSGEADAGLVYATDAVAAGDAVAAVPIPGAERQQTSYVAAPLAQSVDPGLAEEWVALLTAEAGREVLADAGFTLP